MIRHESWSLAGANDCENFLSTFPNVSNARGVTSAMNIVFVLHESYSIDDRKRA